MKTLQSSMKFSILIATDDIDFYRFFYHAFEAKGFTPFFAIGLEEPSHLDETLHLAREKMPDAIILDSKLSAEACERLKQDPRTSSIPVFIMANPGVEQECDRFFKAGKDRLFPRPSMPLGQRAYA